MIEVKVGDLLNMASFHHAQPGMKVGFKSPPGMLTVFMLLGGVDKKAPETFDAMAALRKLGWVPETEINRPFPELSRDDQSLEFESLLASFHEELYTAGDQGEAYDLAGLSISKQIIKSFRSLQDRITELEASANGPDSDV